MVRTDIYILLSIAHTFGLPETGETAEPMPGGNPELIAEVGVDELKSSALAKFVLSVSDRIQVSTNDFCGLHTDVYRPHRYHHW